MATRVRARRRLLAALAVAGAVVFAASIAPVVLLRWIDPPTSAFMLRDRLTAWRSGTPGYEFAHEWANWGALSPAIKVAVVAAEDQKFADHHGFDFASIGDALEDRREGRGRRGASTISQQVAKNLFLWPGQSWVRKGVEAWFTMLIETCWPKRRILEVYLNLAEFGRGTFGAGAAARRYFHKSARELNPYEAARLAAVLPNPERMSVTAPSAYVLERQDWILGQMRHMGGSAWLARLD
jgi:monofunctional glycosyltransferase